MIIFGVAGAAGLVTLAGYGLYHLAFWRSPADQWEAHYAARRHLIHHVADEPGYELSAYENTMRAFRKHDREVQS